MLWDKPVQKSEPEWCDVVIRTLPRMYRLGEVNGCDDCVFVYATAFFSAKEELRRGADGRRRPTAAESSSDVHRSNGSNLSMTKNNLRRPSLAPWRTHLRGGHRACSNRHIAIRTLTRREWASQMTNRTTKPLASLT